MSTPSWLIKQTASETRSGNFISKNNRRYVVETNKTTKVFRKYERVEVRSDLFGVKNILSLGEVDMTAKWINIEFSNSPRSQDGMPLEVAVSVSLQIHDDEASLLKVFGDEPFHVNRALTACHDSVIDFCTTFSWKDIPKYHFACITVKATLEQVLATERSPFGVNLVFFDKLIVKSKVLQKEKEGFAELEISEDLEDLRFDRKLARTQKLLKLLEDPNALTLLHPEMALALKKAELRGLKKDQLLRLIHDAVESQGSQNIIDIDSDSEHRKREY